MFLWFYPTFYHFLNDINYLFCNSSYTLSYILTRLPTPFLLKPSNPLTIFSQPLSFFPGYPIKPHEYMSFILVTWRMVKDI